MEIKSTQYCNKCGRKIDWEWKYGGGDALGKAWKIWFPSQTAGGGAGSGLEDYCWECYGKVCAKLKKIYDYEKSQQVEFTVKVTVGVKNNGS